MSKCIKGHNDCEHYDHDAEMITLAESMKSHVILGAIVQERDNNAILKLRLDDGRTIEIGVSGSLHDEAYLIFYAE